MGIHQQPDVGIKGKGQAQKQREESNVDSRGGETAWSGKQEEEKEKARVWGPAELMRL